MDVGDFVGDSDEDSGIDDASIGEMVPVLVGVEPSAGFGGVLEPEIESAISGANGVFPDDAPSEHEDDTKAAGPPLVEAVPLVVARGAQGGGERFGASVIDAKRDDEDPHELENSTPPDLARFENAVQEATEDPVELPPDVNKALERVDGPPQLSEQRPEPEVDGGKEDEEVAGPRAKFKVGDIVHVAARTWPGINKLGGAGKIASVLEEPGAEDGSVEFLYNVKYMLGGFEKRIEEEYIQDLADALETGVRQHKERIFYHDEFAVSREKKAKPLELEQGEFWPQPEPDATSGAAEATTVPASSALPPAKRSKKQRHSNREKPVLVDAPEIEFHLRSSDDSDYDGSDDDDAADVDVQKGVSTSRRLGEDAFILDDKRGSSNQRKPRTQDQEERRRRREKKLRRRQEERSEENRSSFQFSSTSSARKKRSHRIVESDEEQDDSDHDRAHRGADHRHGKRKRRYIGGYEHGTRDADGSFIQPEGNPTELPDDVAQEVQFELGKTKAEMRVQLKSVASTLIENLDDAEKKRRALSRLLAHAVTLQEDELRDTNTALLELHAFIRDKLIRGGQDVMNIIIEALDRKGSQLPEQLALEYDNLTAKIPELSVWVTQSLRALETTFTRRGIASTFKDKLAEEEARDASDQSAVSNSDDFEYSGDEGWSSDREPPRPRTHSTARRQTTYDEGLGRLSTETNRSRKKRPRSMLQTQSSMDTFAVPIHERFTREEFNRPSAPAMSNFRFVREKDLINHSTDPRWDWVRKLKRTRAKTIVFQRRDQPLHHRELSSRTTNALENKQPMSVMEAVLKLRDKRYRARSQPTTYLPQGRVARSTLLPRPLPLAEQSSNFTGNWVDSKEATRSRDLPVTSPQVPDVVPLKSVRDWSIIFSVLPEEETLPTCLLNSPAKLMRLGRVLYSDNHARDENECWPVVTGDIHGRASVLKQQLSRLRFEEQEAVRAIAESGSEIPFEEDPKWITLSTFAEEYHTSLSSFVETMQLTIHQAHQADVVRVVTSMIAELADLLKQLPDCYSIFSGASEYGYFFEVACPRARSTPLFAAICQTYWYAIQGLAYVKRVCETQWSDEAAHWNKLFVDTLPLNRVALAACLFLVDFYLHVRSSHHIPSDPEYTSELTQSAAPALSLWLLLHELFSVGVLQSTKSAETKTNGAFWNFLQVAYRTRFFDEIALKFVKQESCKGYLKKRAPSMSQGQQMSDEDWQARLLANDTLWDICGLLGVVFQSTSDTNAMPPISSSWTMLTELLSSSNIGFIPLDGVTAKDMMDEELKIQAYGFQLRMLRRILVISAIWTPEKDFIETLIPILWESSLVEEHDEAMLAVVNFIGEVRTLKPNSREHLIELANRHANQTTNSVALVCKIAMIQLVKQEKSILRSRYRQPVLRALSARLENQHDGRALLSQSQQLSKDNEPVEAVKKSVNKSWNWGKSDSKGASATGTTNTIPTTPPAELSDFQREQIIAESKTMLSLLLMFALSSIYLGDGTNTTQQAARRQKELKREIEYFCKEFSSVSSGIPALSVPLCHCVHALGVAALDARTSYSSAFELISSQLKWLSDELQQARRNDASGHQKTRESSVLRAGVSSCLEALRDLSSQLVKRLRVRRDIDPAEIQAVQACITSVLGTGVAASLELAADAGLSRYDFEKAIGIMTHWMPRSRDTPSQCLRYGPSLQSASSHQDEFDEFDDAEMMDLLATVDLANPVASTTDYEAFLRIVDTQASDLAIAYLRLPVQRLLISLPQKVWRSYEELFLVDLLGAMISSCSFTFSWSVVSTTSLKPRNFAPRVLSAVLKHRPEKEWFSTCFLSEQNADVELSSIWLTATLDLQSLLPTESRFEPAKSSDGSPTQDVATARYSSYWLMLTDGIVANLLKENPVVRFKIGQPMYQLLYGTATNCLFRQSVARHGEATDTATLYSMHEDIFRTFCRSAGHIWTTMVADQMRYRTDMNRFRLKMMDAQRGVFVALPDSYEINLRAVCTDLDRKNVNWYRLSSKFLDEFSAPQGAKSLHAVDDAVTVLDRELSDPVIRPLVVLFKFMYDCVDAFLFNCGGMAIGQQNIFYSIIELMFRQARCAEFPVAERRLKLTSSLQAPVSIKSPPTSGITGISPACSGFVESARLFFAYQKYPSLMNWFAQNLDTYQTLKAGWDTSPLRVLLYNIFDPHGPLGIHSYYPIQDSSSSTSHFEPSGIRREAFYLACGLINCRCTSCYEHTRHAPREDQENRRGQLRRFVLSQFVDELKRSAQIDGDSMDETLLPVLQFVKAFVDHLNIDQYINLQVRDGSDQTMAPLRDVEQELLPCLIKFAEYIMAKLADDRTLADTMSCVIMIEFCRLIEEVARLNIKIVDTSLSRFVDIGLRCASFAYESLRKYSSTVMEDLFANDSCDAFDGASMTNSLRSLLAHEDYTVKSEDSVNAVKVEASNVRTTPEDYGISKVRVRSDLLSSIRRLVKQCSEISDSSVLRRTMTTSSQSNQASDVGTM